MISAGFATPLQRALTIWYPVVPNDFGINRAEREKVTKYQDLKNALRDDWDLEDISVIPVIVGATGVMKDNLQKYLDSIPEKTKQIPSTG